MKLKIIQLAKPDLHGSVSLEQLLSQDRRTGLFSKAPLTFEQVGQLAWAGQGATDEKKSLRTEPSVDAVFPVTLYFVTPEGLLVYDSNDHTMAQQIAGNIREKIAKTTENTKTLSSSPCSIIIAGSAKKFDKKHGNKAKRYMLLEAGQVSQNIMLQSASLNLSAMPTVDFNINQLRKVCKMPVTIEPVYISTVISSCYLISY